MEKQRVVWHHENQVAATHGKQRGTKLWNQKESGKRSLQNMKCSTHSLKEKKITWTKSGKESAKRDADLYTMLESAATDEKKKGTGTSLVIS